MKRQVERLAPAPPETARAAMMWDRSVPGAAAPSPGRGRCGARRARRGGRRRAVRLAAAASFWPTRPPSWPCAAAWATCGTRSTPPRSPPLYPLDGLTHVGTSEAGLRSLSRWPARPRPRGGGRRARTADRRAALIAAALTATSPLLVWFSQEARAYSLAVLLCALAFWQLARARRRAPGALVWWAVFAALALSAHYITVFPLLAEAAVLLWWRRDRAAVLAVGAVGLAGLALLPLLVSQRDNPLAGYVHGTPVRQVAEIVKQFAVGYDGPWEALLATLGIALLVTGLALVPAAPARSRAAARLCLLVAVAAPAGCSSWSPGRTSPQPVPAARPAARPARRRGRLRRPRPGAGGRGRPALRGRADRRDRRGCHAVAAHPRGRRGAADACPAAAPPLVVFPSARCRCRSTCGTCARR